MFQAPSEEERAVLAASAAPRSPGADDSPETPAPAVGDGGPGPAPPAAGTAETAPAPLSNPAAPEEAPLAAALAGGFDRDEARLLFSEISSVHPDSQVLPALALTLSGDISGNPSPPCRGPFAPEHYAELVRLCLAVAKGYARNNELAEASTILSILAGAGTPSDDAERSALTEVLALGASISEARNELPEAEALLRRALEVSLALPAGDGQTATNVIILSLRLSKILEDQGRSPIEAEMELMSAATALKKLSGNRALESHPLAPILYMRLANLVAAMGGRSKDVRSHLDQADRSLKAGLASHPEYAQTFVNMEKALSENRRGRGGDDSLNYLWKAVLPADRPGRGPGSPEAMRQELAALKHMGRTDSFGPMIRSAVDWSVGYQGAGSPLHRRYQSLNLKFLEESGNTGGLLMALDEIIASPGTDAEPERSAITVAALKYRARVLERMGNNKLAIDSLSEARVLLLTSPEMADGLSEIEAEIARLRQTMG
jgi:tetratricopeptide (TPR) repeat protein